MSNLANIINEYIDERGNSPYSDWLTGLKDKRARAKIIQRVDRMGIGNFGDSKSVGQSVQELRIPYGPGYRVHYAREGRSVYLLLCGGDKASQDDDIVRAKAYWSEYKRRKKNE